MVYSPNDNKNPPAESLPSQVGETTGRNSSCLKGPPRPPRSPPQGLSAQHWSEGLNSDLPASSLVPLNETRNSPRTLRLQAATLPPRGCFENGMRATGSSPLPRWVAPKSPFIAMGSIIWKVWGLGQVLNCSVPQFHGPSNGDCNIFRSQDCGFNEILCKALRSI